jgi:hypothetical protein
VTNFGRASSLAIEDTETHIIDHEIMTAISTIPPEPVLRLLEPNQVFALPVLQNAMD